MGMLFLIYFVSADNSNFSYTTWLIQSWLFSPKLLLKAVYSIEEVKRIAGRFMEIGISVLLFSKLLAKYGRFIDYKSKLLISILHYKSYSDDTFVCVNNL